MVEAQLVELATAVQSEKAQLMVSELARRHGRICRCQWSDWDELLVNGRLVLTDWSVVFRSYAAMVNPTLTDEMQRVATAETNAGLLEGEQVQASTDLYHLLLHSTSGPALDRVVNAGQQKDSVLGSCWSKGTTHTSGR